MVTQETIDAAVRILAEAARTARIVLLVIEPRVEDRAREMVRLRRLRRPLRVPVDILVFSAEEVARWGEQPSSALYWALREGMVVHG
jgi:hypothetical protein